MMNNSAMNYNKPNRLRWFLRRPFEYGFLYIAIIVSIINSACLSKETNDLQRGIELFQAKNYSEARDVLLLSNP